MDAHDADGRMKPDHLIREIETIFGIGNNFGKMILNALEVGKRGIAYNLKVRLVNSLQVNPITEAEVSHLGKGTYSTVFAFTNPEKANRVLKLMMISPDTIEDILKEILIHIILSTDRDYWRNIPRIYTITRNSKNTKLYIEMDRIDTDLKEILNSDPVIEYTKYSPIIRRLAICMKALNERYGFVHYDFTPANVGLKGDIPQIFDFGFSCITYGGKRYQPTAIFIENALIRRCNPSADFALFFLYIRIYYADRLDDRMARLITTIVNLEDIGGMRLMDVILAIAKNKFRIKRGADAELIRKNYYYASYNYDGELFEMFKGLTPKDILTYLDNLDAENDPVSYGGRRFVAHSSKKNSRHSTNKRKRYSGQKRRSSRHR